ncbi:1-deoxy-D-xylulose-5-phosphate reductoisomerase [Haliovirga abyssi]|uniref:1-deoxy-D-xylulose 5-phosphate reductoisomerase n=1 Tax=Haliovirga abyssi TaxID=2996794 RepID=A0AAU9DEC7_9FUSO|nr:1-deoxy-D-xylulose-5-phosphate reductoisomerase [Haliovirga abyssi]BDU49672.1 1-deoxy-D-xylulose 5-phosphate reductoisomerase [Haliovirga abyssi]
MKKIAILGATGSIGKNGLKVIDQFKDKFEIIALSANKNYKLLIEQIKKYKPKYVSIGTEEGYKAIKKEFSNIEIFIGESGLKKIGQIDEMDILLTAVSGSIGIESTIEAIKNGKRIALANKETLVAAGDIITKMDREILPVDSEHSAIFQSLKSGKNKEVENIILTASGGPFRGYTLNELKNISVEQALKHPNWKMGSKITIDSATLVNKGLEVIEAHYLFNVDYDKIKVLVHPESIVHSMVEFKDSSVIAQMGMPDMKLPIQYAFTYPDRMSNVELPKLNLGKIGKLTFEEPNLELFKGLKLAYEAGKNGNGYPIVFNMANEELVKLFLDRKIKFLEIYDYIEEVLNQFNSEKIETVEQIKHIEKITKEKLRRMINEK